VPGPPTPLRLLLASQLQMARWLKMRGRTPGNEAARCEEAPRWTPRIQTWCTRDRASVATDHPPFFFFCVFVQVRTRQSEFHSFLRNKLLHSLLQPTKYQTTTT
jgi:hypothetical protein